MSISILHDRYTKLVEAINFHDIRYFVVNQPIISDSAYDDMMRQLMELERSHPELIRPDSPTLRIGERNLAGFENVKHIAPMLSLSKLFTPDELAGRLEKMQTEVGASQVEWVIEPKVDGQSVDLRYENGILQAALRRGDGVKGDVVTANARTIRNLPLNLLARSGGKAEVPKVLHIRGEIFMTFSTLKELNAQRVDRGEAPFANCRNAAGGAMSLLDPWLVAQRRLSFKPYTVLTPVGESHLVPESHFARNQWLSYLGFSVFGPEEIQLALSIPEAVEMVQKLGFKKAHLPYPTDGAVIKVDHEKYRGHFGGSSNAPGWAFAYKYEPDKVETKVKGITVQVGRSGILAPVAELEPVEVAGSVVERATLHNENHIKALDIRVGDTVIIHKTGEVIPEIVSVVLSERPADSVPFVFPRNCPCCGRTAVRRMMIDGESESVAWLCSANDDCPMQIEGQLEHWCKAVGIDSFGPALANKLVHADIARSPSDLYKLTEDKMLGIGVGAGIAKRFLKEMEKSKTAGMEAVLIGLGIHRIGKSLSKRLAMTFQNVWQMLDLSDAEFDKKVPNFGKANYAAFQEWKRQTHLGSGELSELEKAGVSMQSLTYNPEAANGPLTGKTFVFTGEISIDRGQAERLVAERGGRTTGSVSKKTSYVVVGAEAGNTKVSKATALGIPMINEEQFKALLT